MHAAHMLHMHWCCHTVQPGFTPAPLPLPLVSYISELLAAVRGNPEAEGCVRGVRSATVSILL